MKKSKATRSLLAACSIVALSAVMYGCVHSGDDTPPPVVEPDPPTAYEAGKAAIMAATTAADARAAHAAVDQTAITGEEAQSLQMALDSRLEMLATAARVAAQKMALTAAAGGIDTSDLSTAEAIAAANNAIALLQAALDNAADVSDADKAMYQTQLDNAKDAAATAQTGLDTAGRMMAQRMAISSAVTAARTAVGMVDNDATDAEVLAADNAVTALKAAIDGAADLPEGDADVVGAQATLTTLEGQLSAAKTSRTAAMEEEAEERRKAAEEEQRKAREAMAATAAKLHAGISAPTATDANTADTADATGTRFAGYVTTADTPTGASVGDIVVGISDNADVALSEDKDTTVAALNGWTGKRYHRTTPASAGTYEAHVYSHVGDPTQGDKFGQIGVATAAAGYEYGLDADGILLEASANVETTAAQVDSPSFDHSAGVKSFELGTNRQ